MLQAQAICLALLLAMTLAAVLAAFNRGGTGSAGALVVNQDTTLQLPPDAVFNFTSVKIYNGKTLRFQKNEKKHPGSYSRQGRIEDRWDHQCQWIEWKRAGAWKRGTGRVLVLLRGAGKKGCRAMRVEVAEEMNNLSRHTWVFDMPAKGELRATGKGAS
jgi:hypothetical protein